MIKIVDGCVVCEKVLYYLFSYCVWCNIDILCSDVVIGGKN